LYEPNIELHKASSAQKRPRWALTLFSVSNIACV
jgi:hypothetical protein